MFYRLVLRELVVEETFDFLIGEQLRRHDETISQHVALRLDFDDAKRASEDLQRLREHPFRKYLGESSIEASARTIHCSFDSREAFVTGVEGSDFGPEKHGTDYLFDGAALSQLLDWAAGTEAVAKPASTSN